MVDREQRDNNSTSERNIIECASVPNNSEHGEHKINNRININKNKSKKYKKIKKNKKIVKLNEKGQPFLIKRNYFKFYTIWWKRPGRGGNDVQIGSVYYHWGVWVGVNKGEVRIAVAGKTKKEAAWRLYRYACGSLANTPIKDSSWSESTNSAMGVPIGNSHIDA